MEAGDFVTEVVNEGALCIEDGPVQVVEGAILGVDAVVDGEFTEGGLDGVPVVRVGEIGWVFQAGEKPLLIGEPFRHAIELSVQGAELRRRFVFGAVTFV